VKQKDRQCLTKILKLLCLHRNKMHRYLILSSHIAVDVAAGLPVAFNNTTETLEHTMSTLARSTSHVDDQTSIQKIIRRPNTDLFEMNRLILKIGWRPNIEITPLSFVPNQRVVLYLGQINLHFIRESWAVREIGLGNFFQMLLNEAQTMTKINQKTSESKYLESL